MFDLAIIGAGPAGMAAAEEACNCGLRVLIVDEQQQPGGQILRRPPKQFKVRDWLKQRIYRDLHLQYERFSALTTLTYLSNTSVLGISSQKGNFVLQVVGSTGFNQLSTERVLIASGCMDMPLSFSGAQMPGVMATGGLQAFYKSQQIVPGKRFVFVGSHPLQIIVANQIAMAGGDVAAVVFTQPMTKMLRILRQPLVLLRQLPNMLFFLKAVLQLLWRRVPIKFGREIVGIEGESELRRVQLSVSGDCDPKESIECDRLGLCFGFLTNNDLVRQAGAHCDWSAHRGGWIAQSDKGQRSSLTGLYVAGETTGVAGANVALLEGRLAALSAAFDAGKLDRRTYERNCKKLQTPLQTAQDFATLLAETAYPGSAFITRSMTEDSMLCKCEEVSVGSALTTLRDNQDVRDLNALKLLTRCGMGHCQGRYCHYQARFLLARERNLPAQSLGGFTARFPIKPVTVDLLIKEQSIEDAQ